VYWGEVSDAQELTIANSGTADLVISTLTAADGFALSADNATWTSTLPGFVVLPDEDLALWLRFEPTLIQEYNESSVS